MAEELQQIAQNTYNTAWNAYRISDQNSDTETKEYLIDVIEKIADKLALEFDKSELRVITAEDS